MWTDDTLLANLLMKGIPKQYEPMILGSWTHRMWNLRQTSSRRKSCRIWRSAAIASQAVVRSTIIRDRSTNLEKSLRWSVSDGEVLGHYISQCQKKPSEKNETRAFNAVKSSEDTMSTGSWIPVQQRIYSGTESSWKKLKKCHQVSMLRNFRHLEGRRQS